MNGGRSSLLNPESAFLLLLLPLLFPFSSVLIEIRGRSQKCVWCVVIVLKEHLKFPLWFTLHLAIHQFKTSENIFGNKNPCENPNGRRKRKPKGLFDLHLIADFSLFVWEFRSNFLFPSKSKSTDRHTLSSTCNCHTLLWSCSGLHPSAFSSVPHPCHNSMSNCWPISPTWDYRRAPQAKQAPPQPRLELLPVLQPPPLLWVSLIPSKDAWPTRNCHFAPLLETVPSICWLWPCPWSCLKIS